jgi:hypothetical protein
MPVVVPVMTGSRIRCNSGLTVPIPGSTAPHVRLRSVTVPWFLLVPTTDKPRSKPSMTNGETINRAVDIHAHF